MRVATDMDVTFTSVSRLTFVEKANQCGAIEKTQGPALDLCVACTFLQDLQPAHLEPETDCQKEVGLVELECETRLGIDKVRVLAR